MREAELSYDARTRVLDAAERLFARKGYAATTLRDIATEVGINHTSLYHHVPGGKEALFVEVTERSLHRHHAGLCQAIAGAGLDIRRQLYAIADWLLMQPPLDLLRMVNVDMPAIQPEEAERLLLAAFNLLLGPVDTVLRQASQRGEIVYREDGPLAGVLLGMIESLFAIPDPVLPATRQEMAYDLIDTLLQGLFPREQSH